MHEHEQVEVARGVGGEVAGEGGQDGGHGGVNGVVRQVPVSEAIRQRKRAQDAEARLAEMGERVSELERDLLTAREALDSAERARQIDSALADADAVDLETARLLTEMAVMQMEEPDVRLAVEELKKKKGFLFRRKRSLMSATAGSIASPGRHRAVEAAHEAAGSGDRAALLAYLRARRGGA